MKVCLGLLALVFLATVALASTGVFDTPPLVFHVAFPSEANQTTFLAPYLAARCVNVTYNSTTIPSQATDGAGPTGGGASNTSQQLYSEFSFNCSNRLYAVDNETMLLLSRSSLPSAVFPFVILRVSAGTTAPRPPPTALPMPASSGAGTPMSAVVNTYFFSGASLYPYPCATPLPASPAASAALSFPTFFQNGPPQVKCVLDMLCFMLLGDSSGCTEASASLFTLHVGGYVGSVAAVDALTFSPAESAKSQQPSAAYFLRSDFCGERCGGGFGYMLTVVATPPNASTMPTFPGGEAKVRQVLAALVNGTALRAMCVQIDGCASVLHDTYPVSSSDAADPSRAINLASLAEALTAVPDPGLSSAYSDKKYVFLAVLAAVTLVGAGLLLFAWVYSGSGAELRN